MAFLISDPPPQMKEALKLIQRKLLQTIESLSTFAFEASDHHFDVLEDGIFIDLA